MFDGIVWVKRCRVLTVKILLQFCYFQSNDIGQSINEWIELGYKPVQLDKALLLIPIAHKITNNLIRI